MQRSLLLAVALILSAPAHAQQPGAGLSLQRAEQVRSSILAATHAPDFEKERMQLEVFRTLKGAGVRLSDVEAIEMAETARARGLPIEAVAAAAQLFDYGVPLSPQAAEYTVVMELLQRQALWDRTDGMERSAKAAEGRESGWPMIHIAQEFAADGQYERAIDLYTRGLARNPFTPTEAEIAAEADADSRAHRRAIEFYKLGKPPRRWEQLNVAQEATAMLNLGIAQFEMKRVDEARATWAAIKGNRAVETLAKVWIDLADASAN